MTFTSDPFPARLEQIHSELRPAAERWIARAQTRRRRMRMVTLCATGLVAAGGVAGAAGLLLGEPAPPNIQRDFVNVNRGMPPELRLGVDAAGAKSVATTGSSTLYLAKVNGGGYCMELATSNVEGRGVGCATPGQSPIDVMVPHSEPTTAESPVTLAGRVNVDSAASLELKFADGTISQIPFGNDLFFVVDVPNSSLAVAHSGEMLLVARDARGAEVARTLIPADWDATAESAPQAPIELDTISDEDDLTKVYGVRGHVTAPGVVSLHLRYADGETVRLPLDGRAFDYEIPAERRDDFMRPNTLVALDANDGVVAQAPVAAVAFWRKANGG